VAKGPEYGNNQFFPAWTRAADSSQLENRQTYFSHDLKTYAALQLGVYEKKHLKWLKSPISDRYCRINDPKRHENNAKLTLFNRFLPVSKTDENGKSPVF